MREAIFNILGPPAGAAALDLFAGTGALGIEALSRGMEKAWFVERDAKALAALHRNLKEFGFDQKRANVLGMDTRHALRALEEKHATFSWIFVDPPYAAGAVEGVLGALSNGNLLDPGAVVVVEHDKRHVPPDLTGPLVMTDRRYYGDTGVSFYRWSANFC